MKTLEELCTACLDIVEETGNFIRQEVGQVSSAEIETKDLNSLVSYVDKTAEKMLVDHLQKLTPEAVFLTEEETVETAHGSLRWIIDPLDGTTNFLHGVPVFAISIALEQEGELVLGVIQEINRKENFYAWKGGGAFLNGKPIRVSGRTELKDCLLATGFPYHDFERTPDYLKVLGFFMQNTRGIRRLGAAAIDLAFVACGRFDAFFEHSIQAWDVAAGIVLVKEAGGKVSDYSGGGKYTDGSEIIASNAHIHQDVQEAVLPIRR